MDFRIPSAYDFATVVYMQYEHVGIMKENIISYFLFVFLNMIQQ